MARVTCNTYNKTVSCINLIEYWLCLTHFHLKCNNLNVVDTESIIKVLVQIDVESTCIVPIIFFPFATINDYKLYQTLGQVYSFDSDISGSYSPKTCSTLKPRKSLSNLFKEFNNFSFQQNKDTENIINCKYYNIDDIQSLNNLNQKGALSLFQYQHVFSS